jgi:hypothetical protein
VEAIRDEDDKFQLELEEVNVGDEVPLNVQSFALLLHQTVAAQQHHCHMGLLRSVRSAVNSSSRKRTHRIRI